MLRTCVVPYFMLRSCLVENVGIVGYFLSRHFSLKKNYSVIPACILLRLLNVNVLCGDFTDNSL
jgi:hypothetical protein